MAVISPHIPSALFPHFYLWNSNPTRVRRLHVVTWPPPAVPGPRPRSSAAPSLPLLGLLAGSQGDPGSAPCRSPPRLVYGNGVFCNRCFFKGCGPSQTFPFPVSAVTVPRAPNVTVPRAPNLFRLTVLVALPPDSGWFFLPFRSQFQRKPRATWKTGCAGQRVWLFTAGPPACAPACAHACVYGHVRMCAHV